MVTDPVDEDKDERDDEKFEQEMSQLDDVLSLDEMGSIPTTAAKTPHPFEGYPMGRIMTIGEARRSTTEIIILKDPDVHQDPSNENVAVEVYAKVKGTNKDIKALDADGRFKAAKVLKTINVNLGTPHSRRVTDYDRSKDGESNEFVFDRELKLEDGRTAICSIVPSASCRAQLMFFIDDKNKLRVDPRYVLADKNQISRLRQVFNNVHYQQMKGERAAVQFDKRQES